MPRKINNKKIIIIIASIIVGILAIVKILDLYYQKQNYSEISFNNIVEEEMPKEEGTEEKIIVYITGEVQNEGVIELEYGSRISDAIEKAGGLKETANIKEVNLAYELEDGQKIYIPNINETETQIINEGSEGVVENEKEDKVININKATTEELQNLEGIGVTLAQNIIEYRSQNGKFNNIEEIKNVPGIGENKFNNIKENIKVK